MAEPFSVCCCQSRCFLALSSLLPTLCTAALPCAHAGAHLAFGELSVTQLNHCGFFFFWVSFLLVLWEELGSERRASKVPWLVQGRSWKSGMQVGDGFGDRHCLMAAVSGRGCSIVPLPGWGPWGGMGVPGTLDASPLCPAGAHSLCCSMAAPHGPGCLFWPFLVQCLHHISAGGTFLQMGYWPLQIAAS